MALLFKQDSPLFGIWKMEESSVQLLSMLDDKDYFRPFLERVKGEGRRQEHLASRVLLKALLGKETYVEYQPDGAPYLPGLPLNISISHTKGYVAVIVGERPVGIDIEYRSSRILKIRGRFMNAEEEAGIDPAHEVEHLLVHWCAKETLFKLIRQENVDFRAQLHVDPFPFNESGVFVGRESRTNDCREYPLAYRVAPDYVLTWSL